MTLVTVLVPMLGRPQSARPLERSLKESTDPRSYHLLFLCSPHDEDAIKACRKVRGAETITVPFDREPGDYARKINFGVRASESEYVFHGASDLRFHQEWLTAAIRAALVGSRARVIGTNDLGNRQVIRGRHSTHSLVHRSYIEEVGTVDEPGKLLHEGYHHNYVDVELVQGAMYRKEWVFCRESVVEHLHPNWGKSDMDETYEIALNVYDFQRDRQLFRRRAQYWRRRR